MSATIKAVKAITVSNERGSDAMAAVTVTFEWQNSKQYTATFNVVHSRVTGYVRVVSGKCYAQPLYDENGDVIKCKTKKEFVQLVDSEAFSDPEFFTLAVTRWVEMSGEALKVLKRKMQSTALTVFNKDTYPLLHTLLEEFKSRCESSPKEMFNCRQALRHLTELVERNINNHCMEISSDSVSEGQTVYFEGKSGIVKQVSEGGTWVHLQDHASLTAMMPTEKWYTQKPSSVVCTVQALLLGVSSGCISNVVTEETLQTFDMVVREIPVGYCYFGQVFGYEGKVYYASGEVDSPIEGYTEVTCLKTRRTCYMPSNRKVFAL